MSDKQLQDLIDNLGDKALEEEQRERDIPEDDSLSNVEHKSRQSSYLKIALIIAFLCIFALFWRVLDLETSLKELYEIITQEEVVEETKELEVVPALSKHPQPSAKKTSVKHEYQQPINAGYDDEDPDYNEQPQNNDEPFTPHKFDADDFSTKNPFKTGFSQHHYATTDWNHEICIYDPLGETGIVFQEILALTPDFNEIEVFPRFIAFTDTDSAQNAFSNGECSMVLLPGYLVSSYNRFSSTFSAIGAIQLDSEITKLLKALTNPKARKLLRSNEIEVVGILPIGHRYFYQTEQSIKRPEDLYGLSLATFDNTPGLSYLADIMATEGLNILNQSELTVHYELEEIDAFVFTELDFHMLDLQDIQESYKIFDAVPIQYATLQLVARQEALPDEDLSQKLRELFLSNHRIILNKRRDFFQNTGQSGSLKYAGEWEEKFRLVRNRLKEQEIYDGKSLKLLWKIRCSADPTRVECATPE